MRRGRYKKNLLQQDMCAEFASEFQPYSNFLKQEYLSGRIKAPEFVAEYVLHAIKILKPENWKGARIQKGEIPVHALEVLRQFSLRGIPLSVNRSLQMWHQGVYRLQLFFHVPETAKVLALQSSGIRCVTCLTEVSELSAYVLGERDPVSFTLHDLIHADHFLFHPEQRLVQIGFSRWMKDLWHNPQVQKAIASDSRFAAQFEYACADMNSHGAHLVKYLKAIFCQSGLESFFHELGRGSPFSTAFQEALEKLNSPSETSSDLHLLQEELLLRGSVAETTPLDFIAQVADHGFESTKFHFLN